MSSSFCFRRSSSRLRVISALHEARLSWPADSVSELARLFDTDERQSRTRARSCWSAGARRASPKWPKIIERCNRSFTALSVLNLCAPDNWRHLACALLGQRRASEQATIRLSMLSVFLRSVASQRARARARSRSNSASARSPNLKPETADSNHQPGARKRDGRRWLACPLAQAAFLEFRPRRRSQAEIGTTLRRIRHLIWSEKCAPKVCVRASRKAQFACQVCVCLFGVFEMNSPTTATAREERNCWLVYFSVLSSICLQ